jgi:predicted component of type VI protein secretion system
VRDAHGHVEDVILTRRPLTVGRAPDCDIVLDDPEIHPVHARIMALSPTEVQIHALPDAGSGRYSHREEDEWLVVYHGEQLLLGSSSLEVLLNERAGVPDDDALASWERAGA